MSYDPVGVVIIGTGLIARFHAQAVNNSGKLKLVAVVHPVEGRGDEFAAEFGVPLIRDYDEAISRDDVGMVLVATPSGAHDDAVFAAARHRKPVLVEKPITISSERADKLIAACESSGTPLGGIFQTRFTEDFRKLKEVVESGSLGRITFVRVDVPWWRDDSYYAGSWHGTREMDGGGALINQAIHMVDWLVALMPPVVDVKSFTATLAHPMEAEDTAAAVLRFEGGALGAIYATTASFPGRPKRMEITGTKGTYVYEDAGHGVSRPDQLQFTAHQECFEAFADSINGGKPYPIGGKESRAALDLIARIYAENKA
ncbi:MAG: Gfo/Idh/MocA family oxidoreductase [Kiritimatiellae bacterium]|nr:Gfo/Idh/MocA family oxidoreductase [Kiritimatiellia bacterium]